MSKNIFYINLWYNRKVLMLKYLKLELVAKFKFVANVNDSTIADD